VSGPNGAVAFGDGSVGCHACFMQAAPRVLPSAPPSALARCRFPPKIIMPAVRRYLRFALSYRDVAELFG
jgi:hypothetical protein